MKANCLKYLLTGEQLPNVIKLCIVITMGTAQNVWHCTDWIGMGIGIGSLGACCHLKFSKIL